MTEQEKLVQAKATFETLCRTLENEQWHYTKDEQALAIECGARGEDLPMELTIKVDADRMLIVLLSRIPFAIQEDKRLDVAIAVTAVNNRLVDGCFDYDVTSGKMFFRMTNSFIDSKIGEDVFTYMLYASCQTIDDYNDKFLMIAKGMLSVQQFLSAMNAE